MGGDGAPNTNVADDWPTGTFTVTGTGEVGSAIGTVGGRDISDPPNTNVAVDCPAGIITSTGTGKDGSAIGTVGSAAGGDEEARASSGTIDCAAGSTMVTDTA